MKVGELFVSLGVKGSEKALGAVGGMRTALNDTAKMSLEAKAGIIGAMYALEQFLSKGTDRATGLENMSAVLGVSVQRLQQLGNAALESRTPLETVTQTLLTAQQGLAKLNAEGQTMPWMARFIQFSGAFKLGPNPFMYLQQHIEELPKFIQQYADVEKDPAMRNYVLNQLGFGGLTAAVARGNFRPDALARAAKMPSLTAGETTQLDQLRVQMAKLNEQIEISLSKTMLKFGPGMFGDIKKVVGEFLQLTDAAATLAKEMGALKIIGTVFEGWKIIFEGWTLLLKAIPGMTEDAKSALLGLYNTLAAPFQKKEFVGPPAARPGIEAPYGLGAQYDPNAKNVNNMFGDKVGQLLNAIDAMIPGGISLTKLIESLRGNQAGAGASVNVNQSFHFDDTKDKKGVADAAAAGVKSAYRQNPAILRHS